MTIFDQLQDITTTKLNKISDNVDELESYQPYMVQRWLSMYSPQFAQIINVSSNRMWRVFSNSREWNQFFISIIPTSPVKRIRYIKKQTKKQKDTTKNKDVIDVIADSFEISKREAKQYIDQELVDLKEIKKEYNL